MKRAKTKRTPRKPAPKAPDLSTLRHHIAQAKAYAAGSVVDVVTVLSALQDPGETELVLKALAALAGDVEAACDEVRMAEREIERLTTGEQVPS